MIISHAGQKGKRTEQNQPSQTCTNFPPGPAPFPGIVPKKTRVLYFDTEKLQFIYIEIFGKFYMNIVNSIEILLTT